MWACPPVQTQSILWLSGQHLRPITTMRHSKRRQKLVKGIALCGHKCTLMHKCFLPVNAHEKLLEVVGTPMWSMKMPLA